MSNQVRSRTRNNELNYKKKWFNRYKILIDEEQYLINKLDLLVDKMHTVQSVKFNNEPRGGLPITLDDRLIQKERIKQRIAKVHKARCICRNEILEVLCIMEDYKSADILERHYLDLETWETISDSMGYSYRHIHRLYKKALELVEIPTKNGIH